MNGLQIVLTFITATALSAYKASLKALTIPKIGDTKLANPSKSVAAVLLFQAIGFFTMTTFMMTLNT